MSAPAGSEAASRLESHAARVAALHAALDPLPGLAVAFSGGVDSAVLLHAAHARLRGRALGVIADSASLPRAELAGARAVAAAIGVELVVLPTAELDDPRYRANPADRCYFCKHALFAGLEQLCAARGLAHVAFGEIADDRALVRHGSRAAREFRVLAPLADAGFTKQDVRRYAREHGLPCAEKPASACLASRIPTGTPVTRERLARVERAETGVRALGFAVLRVRDLGTRARVEVGADELARAERARAELQALLRSEGFLEVELAAYRAPAPGPGA